MPADAAAPAFAPPRRVFSDEDQEGFAALSGDRNPIHMDGLAARRTQAGAPVVHGVHLLLWCLDRAARELPNLSELASLRMRFEDFVYIGDSVEAVLIQQRTPGLRMDLRSRGLVVVRLSGTFGPRRPAPEGEPVATQILRPAAPAVIGFEELHDRSGRAALPDLERAAAAFPDLARALGARRVAALIATTYLVGMICPGLHSVFGGMTVDLCDDAGADCLDFRVTKTDPRFRSGYMKIAGGGLAGTVESFVRLPPVAQAGTDEIAGRVSADEFAGQTALVIGGSRGLGELTAKLLAAGGATVTITYAAGEADARQVAAQIVAAGGVCDVVRYDARRAAEAQLNPDAGFDALYYFATPFIFKKTGGLFNRQVFDEFAAFYVDGFYDVVRCLAKRRTAGISVFYPSSVAVTEPVGGMAEYAMAKSAAETLCAYINTTERNVSIVTARLPRLPTDQTASLTEIETADPMTELLPILRAVHAGRSA